MLRNMQFWNPKFECNFLSFEYTKWECISFRGELVTTRMSSQQNVQFVDLPFLNVSMCRKFWVYFFVQKDEYMCICMCRKMGISVFVMQECILVMHQEAAFCEQPQLGTYRLQVACSKNKKSTEKQPNDTQIKKAKDQLMQNSTTKLRTI